MSWSFSCIGKPAKVADAIDKYSGQLTGQSKVEFDAAKPHLIALVKENFSDGDGPLIDFDANGSGYSKGDEQVQRSLQVSIKPQYKTLV